MKDVFGVIAGGALMVVCCLLPFILVGAGSATIAGILAWIGDLDPILVLAVVGGGGILAYHVVRRARVVGDRRSGLPRAAPAAAPRKEDKAREGFRAPPDPQQGGPEPERKSVTRRFFQE